MGGRRVFGRLHRAADLRRLALERGCETRRSFARTEDQDRPVLLERPRHEQAPVDDAKQLGGHAQTLFG